MILLFIHNILSFCFYPYSIYTTNCLLLDEYVDAAERKKVESTITTRMVCKYALGKEGGN